MEASQTPQCNMLTVLHHLFSCRIKSKHTKSGVVVASFGRGLAHQFEQPPGAGLTIPVPEVRAP